MGLGSAVASFGRGNRLSFLLLFNSSFSSPPTPPPLLSSSPRAFLFLSRLFSSPHDSLASFRYLPFSTPLANPPRRVLLLGIIRPVHKRPARSRTRPSCGSLGFRP